MQRINCTKCKREVETRHAAVRYTSTLGTKKHCIPEPCWTTGNCREKEVKKNDDKK